MLSRLRLRRAATGSPKPATATCADDASLEFSVINTSAKDLEITYAIVDYLTGQLASVDAGIQLVSSPTATDEGVTWRFAGFEAGVVAGRSDVPNPMKLGDRVYRLSDDQVGTGIVKSGGHNPVQHDFLVRSKVADAVGFVIHFGIDGGKTEATRPSTRVWKLLPPTVPAEKERWPGRRFDRRPTIGRGQWCRIPRLVTGRGSFPPTSERGGRMAD